MIFVDNTTPGNALAGELDEAHMLLDAAERSRKGAEMEVRHNRFYFDCTLLPLLPPGD